MAGAVSLKPPPIGAQPSRMGLVAPQASLSALAAPRLSPSLGDPNLQGVDLRLDNFDLTEAKRVSKEADEGSWGSGLQPLDACVSMGDSFWSCLDDNTNKTFKEDDRALLKTIFDPSLSDRRMEGDLFAPPDATQGYVTKLRALIKEEQAARDRRKEVFFSKDFVASDPGSTFPLSWQPAFEVEGKTLAVRTNEDAVQNTLVAKPEYKEQVTELLEVALKESGPIFNKTTEEGLRFKIYRLGNLEVRTTQEANGDEIVGAVYSLRSPQAAATIVSTDRAMLLKSSEAVAKVIEYVERAFPSEEEAKDCTPSAYRRYFIVLETASGNRMVLEKGADGSVTWEEQPKDLEDRCSLARVIRSTSLVSKTNLGQVLTKALEMESTGKQSPSDRKSFAHDMYSEAVGKVVLGLKVAYGMHKPENVVIPNPSAQEGDRVELKELKTTK